MPQAGAGGEEVERGLGDADVGFDAEEEDLATRALGGRGGRGRGWGLGLLGEAGGDGGDQLAISTSSQYTKTGRGKAVKASGRKEWV